MCDRIYLQSAKDFNQQINVDCLHSSINIFYQQKRCPETGIIPWYVILENKKNKYTLKESDILHLIHHLNYC